MINSFVIYMLVAWHSLTDFRVLKRIITILLWIIIKVKRSSSIYSTNTSQSHSTAILGGISGWSISKQDIRSWDQCIEKMARNQRLCVKTAICELMRLNPLFKNLPPEPLVANFIASLVLMCVHFATVQFSMVWYGQRKSRKPNAMNY